jgi:methylated-DNA-[protein]-cysteine S-methyltransferase
MHLLLIQTSQGSFFARFTDLGLARLEFPSDLNAASATPMSRAGLDRTPYDHWERLTRLALDNALIGRPTEELPPFDLSAGTDFQRGVWALLARIPIGRTLTYTQVASALGRPKSARAVGQACGANPIPVLIPCHRVLAARGQLGGFSGGLGWKRKLLAVEQEKATDAAEVERVLV